MFTACGGGGGDDDESDPTNDRDPLATLDTSDGDTDDTDFTFPELPDAEFEEYPDGQIRFANFWRQGNEGSPVDLYWGYSAETGEKIDTLEYGTVSDWYTMKIETNGLTVDDETRLRVLIQMPGDETSEGILQTLDPTLDGEHRWTVVMGWTDTSTPIDLTG